MPYLILVLVFIILGYHAYQKTPKAKGRKGEKQVDRVLKQAALKHGGVELWDLMYEDPRSSSQIDNVLLTQRALYVCEVKNYRGRIFGSADQASWTMTLITPYTKRNKKGKKVKKSHLSKHRFYNPVQQNTTHIRKITHVLEGYPVVPVINLVVFGYKADVSMLQNLESVLSIKKLQKHIDVTESMLPEILSVEDQIGIVDRLHEMNITDKKARKAHVANIRLRYKT